MIHIGDRVVTERGPAVVVGIVGVWFWRKGDTLVFPPEPEKEPDSIPPEAVGLALIHLADCPKFALRSTGEILYAPQTTWHPDSFSPEDEILFQSALATDPGRQAVADALTTYGLNQGNILVEEIADHLGIDRTTAQAIYERLPQKEVT